MAVDPTDESTTVTEAVCIGRVSNTSVQKLILEPVGVGPNTEHSPMWFPTTAF